MRCDGPARLQWRRLSCLCPVTGHLPSRRRGNYKPASSAARSMRYVHSVSGGSRASALIVRIAHLHTVPIALLHNMSYIITPCVSICRACRLSLASSSAPCNAVNKGRLFGQRSASVEPSSRARSEQTFQRGLGSPQRHMLCLSRSSPTGRPPLVLAAPSRSG